MEQLNAERRGRRAGRYRHALVLGPLLISVATIAFLVSVVEGESRQMVAMTGRLTIEGVCVLAVLFGIQQYGRAARLRTLFSGLAPTRRMVEIVLIHQLCDYLLPLKTGELALPELLKLEGVKRPVAFAMLVVMRGCDLLLATLLLLVALLLFPGELPDTWPYELPHDLPLAIGACGLVGLLAVGLRWASRRGDRWPPPVHWNLAGAAGVAGGARLSGQLSGETSGETSGQTLWRKVGLPGGRALRAGWLGGKLKMFCEALASLTARQFWLVVLVTLGISLVGIAFNLFFCWQLAPELRWQSALLVVLTMPLVSQFPLRGWAGVGTSEAMLVVLFSLAGMSASAAFSLAICGRLFHFALLSTSGVAASWLYVRGRRAALASPQL